MVAGLDESAKTAAEIEHPDGVVGADAAGKSFDAQNVLDVMRCGIEVACERRPKAGLEFSDRVCGHPLGKTPLVPRFVQDMAMENLAACFARREFPARGLQMGEAIVRSGIIDEKLGERMIGIFSAG